jgi:hypothetical protein
MVVQLAAVAKPAHRGLRDAQSCRDFGQFQDAAVVHGSMAGVIEKVTARLECRLPSPRRAPVAANRFARDR